LYIDVFVKCLFLAPPVFSQGCAAVSW